MPEAAVLKDFTDHIILAGFNEGDNLHGAAAVGAEEGIGVVNTLDEDGPTTAGLAVGR